MNSRRLLWSALGAIALFIAISGGWILSLPPMPSVAAPSPIAQQETDATIAALKPPKRAAPADRHHRDQRRHRDHHYLMPYGILKRADIAEMVAYTRNGGGADDAVSGAQGRAAGDDRGVRCAASRWRRLRHRAAMSRDDDPAALQWIRNQSARGAIIIGVCAGAKAARATPGCCTASGKRPPTGIPSRSCAKIIPRSATSKTAAW